MNYRVGDWVEVLGPAEILQTLDDDGGVDNMPFMPEMLQFAGKRFQVSASAHKTCDTILGTYHNRRVDDSVHLGVRCDGSAHGGCQADCLLYWKTTWLRPADGPAPEQGASASQPSALDTSVIEKATRAPRLEPSDNEVRYSCQVTQLAGASSPMSRTDVRQYWKDLTSGNVSLWTMIRYMALAVYNTAVGRLGRGRKIPSIKGLAGRTTPSEVLNLQPGELVEVKSADEIMRTLDANYSNRGMVFDIEMLRYCGKRYRVKERVNQLINEKTGVMMTIKTPGIILDDVVCVGCLHPARMFCPRGIYPYWREIWLKRVDEDN